MMIVPLFMMAQSNDHPTYWIRYQNHLSFKKGLLWSNEIDNRRFINPDVQNQLIFHSRLHHKSSRWDYATGVTVSWAYAGTPGNVVSHPTTEFRPVIEASHEVPLKSWALQQRFRLDNRFFEEDRFESLLDGTDYMLRLRYRIQARINLVKDNNGLVTTTLRLADEIMFNHKQNLFDQNRIYATVDFFVDRNWNLEAGYIFIHQQRLRTDLFFQRHVLRFSLLHKVKL